MNVGVFIGSYSPDIGGAHTFVTEICRAIETDGPTTGHKFIIFTFSQYAPVNASADGTIQLVVVNNTFQKNYFFRLLKGVVCFVNRVLARWFVIDFMERIADPISAHIKENSIDVTWSLLPECLSTKVPFITTVWDLEHRNQPFFPEVSLKDEWDCRERRYSELLRKAAYVITGTNVGKLEIEKYYHVPGERIRVLPLPAPHFKVADSHRDDEIIRQQYGLPERYLLYPAQFWPHKNHYGVLIALQLLHEKYNIRLPVVFVGSDMGNLKYICKLVSEFGMTEQVHFLGFIPRNHLAALYRNAFALLYLSFFGPDNLPPLEAFALGCPVIASKVSGAEEQLGDAALIVDAKYPIDIANAINWLLNDTSLRQTLVERGLERASKWTSVNYLKGICSIFEEFENIRRTWSRSEPFNLVR